MRFAVHVIDETVTAGLPETAKESAALRKPREVATIADLDDAVEIAWAMAMHRRGKSFVVTVSTLGLHRKTRELGRVECRGMSKMEDGRSKIAEEAAASGGVMALLRRCQRALEGTQSVNTGPVRRVTLAQGHAAHEGATV